MSISNIESSGFNSLFKSSEALMAKTVEANVPSQTERNLKSSNRSLSSDNISLEGKNRLLSEKNDDLVKDNRNLTQDLKESEQNSESNKNVETTRSEQMASAENNNQQPTRSEEKSNSADNIDTTNYDYSTIATNTAPSVEAPAINSYSMSGSTDLSGLEIGASFSSYA